MNYFFTADEHYFHANIIKYANRPFATIKDMFTTLVDRHNEVVKNKKDMVIHAGDFSFANYQDTQNIIKCLNGTHYFIRGSHDYWMSQGFHEMWEKNINGVYVVVCHYAMRTWGRSHYNSWNLYGHAHGGLAGVGKQMDIGVDTVSSNHERFYPYSFEEIHEIMKYKPNNFNFISERNKNE